MKPGRGEWLSGSNFTQPHYDRMPLQHGTPSKMTMEEYISSTCDPGDLALVFNATYERSNDYAESDGDKRLRARVDNANNWYEHFSDR